jgi:hypothetical protein
MMNLTVKFLIGYEKHMISLDNSILCHAFLFALLEFEGNKIDLETVTVYFQPVFGFSASIYLLRNAAFIRNIAKELQRFNIIRYYLDYWKDLQPVRKFDFIFTEIIR